MSLAVAWHAWLSAGTGIPLQLANATCKATPHPAMHSLREQFRSPGKTQSVNHLSVVVVVAHVGLPVAPPVRKQHRLPYATLPSVMTREPWRPRLLHITVPPPL